MRKLLGRAKIFTSESSITAENVLEVLDKAMSVHRQNVADIQFLIDYDRGKQALPRPKVNRKEIDIHANSSLPDYIKRFKKGYNWGSPIMLIQRGDMEMHETEARRDDRGIAALNELLKNVVAVANNAHLPTAMGSTAFGAPTTWVDGLSVAGK